MGDRKTPQSLDDQANDQPQQRDDRGASLVEYVLMVSLIALVCVAALNYFQDETAESFSSSASSLAQAGM